MAAPKGRSKGPKRRGNPDNGPAGVEPGTRTFTTWSPSLIKSAELQADGGNIRQAANLCDWILADDRVKGCLNIRLNALLGLDPTFEESGDGRRKGRAVRALEGGEDYWASYPATELDMMHRWGIVLGIGPMRHNPHVRTDKGGNVQHGGRLLPFPEFWHPQHFRQDQFTREWTVRVQAGPTGGVTEEVMTPGDGEWVFHQPFGPHRPQMLGLWRGLARWVLVKWLAVSDISNASSKGSTLAATNEKGVVQKDEAGRSNLEQRRQLANDIFQRGKDGVIILPPGFDLKLLQTAANSESIYKAQVDLANEAIAIAIRGGNLTTNVSEGGSLAATESQERLGDQANLVWDGDSVTTTIHDQSLAYWALWNFGDSALAPWPVYPTKPRRDLGKKAEATLKATDAAEGLMSLGLEIEAQAFIDENELGDWVKPAQGQKLLVVPTPNPAGPPPGKAAKPATPAPAPTEAPPAPAEPPAAP